MSIGPREDPFQACLEGVHVPGREAHGSESSPPGWGYPRGVAVSITRYGGQSATAPLRVVLMAEVNPNTQRALLGAGCDEFTYPATEIGINGSGGPTCMTRAIWREMDTRGGRA
jgi:hypothetical protein